MAIQDYDVLGIVNDLLNEENEDAANLIVDLVEQIVNETDEEVETVLSLTLPDLKEAVGRDDTDEDDLLGSI